MRCIAVRRHGPIAIGSILGLAVIGVVVWAAGVVRPQASPPGEALRTAREEAQVASGEVDNVTDGTLIEFSQDFDMKAIEMHGRGVAVRLVDSDGGKSLHVGLGRARGAGISFLAPPGGWDLTQHVAVALDIANVGASPVALRGRLNKKDWIDGFAALEPGQTDTVEIILKRTKEYRGMKGVPGGHLTLWEEADPAQIVGISIASIDPIGAPAVEIKAVRAVGEYVRPPAGGVDDALLPFVDRYGQYKHSEWPGKTQSDDELAAQRTREDDDLDAHPSPSDWNQYGGWAAGPQLEATGHFRVEKHDGKWWLVDPEGRLFWSHGITCVWLQTLTRVAGREHYFEELDDRFVEGDGYDFAGLNLLRKYGEAWQEEATARAHRRLRSWGMNTTGNWTHEQIYSLRRTPYTVAIHYSSPNLGRFPYRDMDLFRQVLRDRLEEEKGKTVDDPWCIGYFVDNELRWPRRRRAELADDYYRICREEVKRAAPNKLYLGSRLHGHMSPFGGTEDTVRAAAKYCDVVSINRYRFSPGDLRMPKGIDMPIIIGEWHFGALDRGLLHTGLRSVGSQEQRAAGYRHYVRTALRHPNIVGTHWFQYRDQMVTGRFDGENYQIGFIDICDTPYWETIAASRQVGAEMYQVRSGQ
jgi:hypothetical protein